MSFPYHTFFLCCWYSKESLFPLAVPPTHSRLGECWNKTGIWMLTHRHPHIFCPGCFNSCFSSYSRVSTNEVSGSQNAFICPEEVMKSRMYQFKTFLIPNQSPGSLSAKNAVEEWAQFKTNLEFIINLGWFKLVVFPPPLPFLRLSEVKVVSSTEEKASHVMTCCIACSHFSDELQGFAVPRGNS